MTQAAKNDWPVGHIIFIPVSWRDDNLWTDIQTEAQGRIGADLRAMYDDLLQQPLSPTLRQLVCEIETRIGSAPDAGSCLDLEG